MHAPLLADESATTRFRISHLRRLWIFVAAATIEILVATLVFDSPMPHPGVWLGAIHYVNMFAKGAIAAFVLLLLAAWPRQGELIEAYRLETAKSSTRLFVAINVAAFVALLGLRIAILLTPEPPSYLLSAYIAALLMTGVSLALLAAPPAFWWKLPRIAPVEIAIALIGGGFTLLLGHIAQQGWNTLAGTTLMFSHWILSLYESNVILDTGRYLLGAGKFSVVIDGRCSGYEGITLILIFLSIYIWGFREQLRFPNVLLLLPLGAAAMWLLNGLRLAILVSIGAHVSPEMAMQGFHSQAGWISFLCVTLASIAISRRIPFFTASVPRAALVTPVAPAASTQTDQSLAYLAPFMAMLVANLLASAFAPHDQWLYPVKIVAIGAALWWFRDAYVPLIRDTSWLSVAVGLAVGALWIVSDPGRGEQVLLGDWIAVQPVELAVAWLTLRALGTVVFVPIAEELAFRGFLARWLISARFESVDFGQFRPLAFIVSSMAFGVMHERWLAAFLAGAVFALLMYRTRRLSDAVVAHAVANLAIFVWAVADQQWSLL
jgi:exosortase E/protease (VPEID-CTERM system)